MRTLVAQPASAIALHCYIGSGPPFNSHTPASVLAVEGVRGAYLVTANRPQHRWCLVLRPSLAVERDNAEALHGFVNTVARQLGCSRLQFLRPVERREGGVATDMYDWLKW